ncbi:hypothetical protein NQ317_001184, partial [Molorchus minor]
MQADYDLLANVSQADCLLLVRIPYTKISKKRTFTGLTNGFEINPIDLYRKYSSLRLKTVKTSRLFLTYRRKRCTYR